MAYSNTWILNSPKICVSNLENCTKSDRNKCIRNTSGWTDTSWDLSYHFCFAGLVAGAGPERSGSGVSCLNVIILWHGGHFLSGPVHDSLHYRGFSIPASNVEKFLESKQLELGLNSPSFKAFIVLFLNGLFRVVSLAILMEFFEPFALICIAANLIMLLVCSVICFYEWIGCVIFEFLESSVLGILTVTHLGPSRSAALLRLMSSYSFFFLYSIILIVIAAICNTNPESVVIPLFNIVWSELAIVQQISYLNLAIISTITSGLLSLLLDLMLACCNKSEDGSWGWNETILHEWVSRRTQQEEDPNIQTQRVERSSDGIEDDSSIDVIHIDEQYNTNMWQCDIIKIQCHFFNATRGQGL